jgi:hypothetical protein
LWVSGRALPLLGLCGKCPSSYSQHHHCSGKDDAYEVGLARASRSLSSRDSMKKEYAVSVIFPEVLVKHSRQEIRVSASNLRLAANEALKAIMKREGIKGRRLTRLQLAVIHAGQTTTQDHEA